MKKIIEYLQQLELSEIEAKMYLTLLQAGPVSVRDLANLADVKRTTAYLYVDQLADRGLIVKYVKHNKKLVAANDPESLKHLVENKVESAKVAVSTLPSILERLQISLPEYNSEDESEIKYYKGKLGIKKVYEDSLKSKELRLYANLSQLKSLLAQNDYILSYDVYEKGLEENKDLKIYEIVADTPGSIDDFELDVTTQKNNRYQHKYMPSTVGLTSPGILLYDNKVAIIHGRENFSILVLHNADYYINSVKLFDFIWNVLPENK